MSENHTKQLNACYDFPVSMKMVMIDIMLVSSLSFLTVFLLHFICGTWQFTKMFLFIILLNPQNKPMWEVLALTFNILGK